MSKLLGTGFLSCKSKGSHSHVKEYRVFFHRFHDFFPYFSICCKSPEQTYNNINKWQNGQTWVRLLSSYSFLKTTSLLNKMYSGSRKNLDLSRTLKCLH